MFDYHVARILRQQWESTYSQSFSSFLRVYAGASNTGDWEDELLATWTRLSKPDYVTFIRSYNWSPFQFPIVAVCLKEEKPFRGYFGYDNGPVDGQLESKGTIVSQTIEISIVTEDAEEVMALHEFCRQMMIAHRIYFHRIGYTNLVYDGASEVAPNEELLPDSGLNNRVRVLTWTVVHEPAITLPVDAATGVQVYANDLTISGVYGGVTPTEDPDA